MVNRRPRLGGLERRRKIVNKYKCGSYGEGAPKTWVKEVSSLGGFALFIPMFT